MSTRSPAKNVGHSSNDHTACICSHFRCVDPFWPEISLLWVLERVITATSHMVEAVSINGVVQSHPGASKVKQGLKSDLYLLNQHVYSLQGLHRKRSRRIFESESFSVVYNSLWPHGLYSPWNSPGQNTGVGSLSLLPEIFPIQGSNPGLLHCRWILYQLSHKGSLRILEWVAYPFSRGSSQPKNWTRVSCIAGGFFTNWDNREATKDNIYIYTSKC